MGGGRPRLGGVQVGLAAALLANAERHFYGAKLNHCVPLPHRQPLFVHGRREGEE